MSEKYISKSYEIKFLKFFKLCAFSEDRGNGEYKHFVDVYLFKWKLCEICYRTGADNINGGYIWKLKPFAKHSFSLNIDDVNFLSEIQIDDKSTFDTHKYTFYFRNGSKAQFHFDEENNKKFINFYYFMSNLDKLNCSVNREYHGSEGKVKE